VAFCYSRHHHGWSSFHTSPENTTRTPLWFFIGFTLLGFGVTVAMFAYEWQMRRRIRELDPKLGWTAFGGALATYAGIATMATITLLFGMWVYLIAKWPPA
jgi:hypothetical protein